MIVIVDAGPLLALAKIGALNLLTSSYDTVFITPTVYAEAVTAGRALNAPDADLIEEAVKSGQISVRTPVTTVLPVVSLVHTGERESICLAIELGADVLLVDDAAARRTAHENLRAANARTQLKGTLGLIVSAVQHGYLTREAAVDYVRALQARPDVWLSRALCDRVIRALMAG